MAIFQPTHTVCASMATHHPNPVSLSLSSASSSLLSISSRHFREISDPITQLLGQLHRLVYLSQAPPTSSPSAREMVIDQYQRALFHPDMSPAQLKGELHRLETRSGEGVWLLEEGVWSIGPRLVRKAMEELAGMREGNISGGNYVTHIVHHVFRDHFRYSSKIRLHM